MGQINNKDLDTDFIISNLTPYKKKERERKAHVYFLSYKGIIVYVGMSLNYEGRLLQHSESKAFDSFYVTECDESIVKDIESHYIDKFRPFYNIAENFTDQFVPNNTYIKHEDVILLNSGGKSSANRMILDVKGSVIFNAFDSKTIGYVVNRIGFIYNGLDWSMTRSHYNHKIVKCKDGVSETIKIKSNIKIFEGINGDYAVPYFTTVDLLHVYDYYIFSKLMNYKLGWFVKQAEYNKLTYDNDILLFIDKIFSMSRITMQPKPIIEQVPIKPPKNKDWMWLAKKAINNIERRKNY